MPSSTDASTTQQYIEILEKTNQQLSLWLNPYGIMVGVLTLLVAFIAIAVTYALYRNSKEQKDLAKGFYEKQTNIIEERNRKIEGADAKLDELIAEYQKKLQDTTQDNKKEIEKAITELKKEKASFTAFSASAPIVTGFSSSVAANFPVAPRYDTPTVNLLCRNCGREFLVPGTFSDSIEVYQGRGKKAYCPYCNAEQDF